MIRSEFASQVQGDGYECSDLPHVWCCECSFLLKPGRTRGGSKSATPPLPGQSAFVSHRRKLRSRSGRDLLGLETQVDGLGMLRSHLLGIGRGAGRRRAQTADRGRPVAK